MTTTGRCLCGDIRYAYEGEPLWVAHCHCESCRRQTSSAVATFVGVRRDGLVFTAGQPAVYHSSPGVDRTFCGHCGAPIAYANETVFPGEIHLYIGTLDNPGDLRPAFHVHTGEQLAWFEVEDDLPRYETSGRGATPVGRGPRSGPR
jgi:hypothetical protein